MRIAFVCDTMDSGGAERVISSLANSFASFGHEISIVMLAKRANGSFYELSNSIKLIGLTNLLSKEPSSFKKCRLLKKQITDLNPDIVISFLSSISGYLLHDRAFKTLSYTSMHQRSRFHQALWH